jgi:hypothetical protein
MNPFWDHAHDLLGGDHRAFHGIGIRDDSLEKLDVFAHMLPNRIDVNLFSSLSIQERRNIGFYHKRRGKRIR